MKCTLYYYNDYLCVLLTSKTNIMTTFQKCIKTNKVSFFRNGKQVFDFRIKGNIVSFSNGDVILI